MISTNFDTFQSHQNEPIVRQGQRTGRRRKHYHAPAKQDTSKRPPLERKIPMARQREHAAFHAPAQRNNSQRCNRHDSRTGTTNSALQDSSTSLFLRQSQWHGNFFHMQTLSDAFGRLRTLSATREPTSEHDLTPRPHLITGTLRYAFGKKHLPLKRVGGRCQSAGLGNV